ncbi:amino acid adenylation domain-containing protein, partial [Ramlibacter sp.]|uniref:non-ribosomal peptide synthetase n=1 Tax=Ramlibacter sp. TaxID=1917967 RepID=UPI002D486E37
RGFRIELGEIEAQLGRLADEVVVMAREDAPGDRRLVAYYTGEASEQQLREQALQALPGYMVPAAYVKLEALPLTPNGKVDRKALPAPEGTAYVQRAYEAPQGEVETRLAALWAELLGSERIGRRDNFFELGGHSLLAVRLIERMRREGLHVDVRELFTAPTLSELAVAVGGASREVEVPPNLIPEGAARITPQMLTLAALDQESIDRLVAQVEGGSGNVQDIYPLAPAQEGILFHHLMESEGDPYLLPSLLSFPSKARLERFLAAMQQVIDRHDILRTGVHWQGLEQPLQVVRRRAKLPVETVRAAPGQGGVREQLEARLDPGRNRLDVSQAPLMRCMAAEDEGQGRWLLGVLAHHLAIDHTTLELLVEEAQAIERGNSGSLAPPAPFRNFVAQARLGVSQAEHEAFFGEMLKDVDEPTAPYGVLDVRGDGRGIVEVRKKLEGALSAGIRQEARRLGVSAASVMHLAWSVVLGKLTGRDDVVFGTVLFGRMQGGEQADRVMGMFINSLPVRVRLGATGVTEGLRRTHALLARLLRHEHAPLALAQRCSGVDAQAPLFTTLLNYRHTRDDDAQDAPQADDIEVLGGQERTNYPLTMSVDDLGSDFMLVLQAREPIDAERVCRYMETALAALLPALSGQPALALGELEILPQDEREQVLHGWNATARPYPQGGCLHELIEAQVARRPDGVALDFGGQELSYRELNEHANRLARHLVALGAGPDRRVAVCAERGFDMVLAVLAVLKAGGAYVPLDPDYPGERLAHMLADSAPAVVLADDSGARALDGLTAPPESAAPRLHLQADRGQWAGRSAENLDARELGLRPDHLAYVIYTSGSTGLPKGAMNEHRGIVNRLLWMQEAYALDDSDVVLQKTPFSFDVSVWEFFWPLMYGARLVLAKPGGHKDPAYLSALMRAQGVTTVHFVPSMLQAYLEQPDLESGALKRVICSGEALPGALARRFHARLSTVALHNLYGPTEAAVDVTSWHCQAGDERATVPLGRPVANTRIYVLDGQRRPAPVGVAGEIYIGGAQVGRGYLNRPELTRERFLPDPFSGEPEARMYKTGDLGRWLPDGTVEYLGRTDFQVKIRGFRIELGEIEAQLGRLADEVVVMAREDAPGDRRLVAYYTGEASEQ